MAKIDTSPDFLWQAMISHLHGAKKTPKNFLSFNCPMCVTRGETADKRRRGGVKRGPDGIGINCFNCGFKSRYKPGESLSKNMQSFLVQLGVSHRDVLHLAHRALTIRRAAILYPESTNIDYTDYSIFPACKLPSGSKTLEKWAEEGCSDERFLRVIEYLGTRGSEVANSTSFYWTPEADKNDLDKRIIIPMFYDGKIVGWTARAVYDGISPKYFSEKPEGFIFNADLLSREDREFIIIVEGPFDALALSCTAIMNSTINSKLVDCLNSTNKTKIVLADRDSTGKRTNTRGMIDVALENIDNNWAVSFPKLKDGKGFNNWWEKDIKDAAQAVERYGRLYTLRSVINSATAHIREIKMKRGWLV